MREIVLDFLSQRSDMRIDRPVCDVHVLAPDMFQELVSSDDLTGAFEQ